MKIDETTYVPFSWLALCVVTIAGGSITIALSLSNMNYRISRVEEALHLPPYNSFSMEPDASAKNLRNHPQRKGE